MQAACCKCKSSLLIGELKTEERERQQHPYQGYARKQKALEANEEASSQLLAASRQEQEERARHTELQHQYDQRKSGKHRRLYWKVSYGLEYGSYVLNFGLIGKRWKYEVSKKENKLRADIQ